ncbi:MAG: phosphatidylserine decarboxylase family protein [Calditrichia bacterium]
MVAKDGMGLVIGSFVLLALVFGLNYFFPHAITSTLVWILAVFVVFNLYFFRDPNRRAPKNELAVIAPGDGKVVDVTHVTEPEYFNNKVQRISIFLSVFNVHVNRSPISGTVDYFAYHPGKFLAAFKEKASIDNEQTAIGISMQSGQRVLFKQIAGLIARRIICNLKEGQWTNAGERMGMIRYGSRVDVFVPFDAKIQVKVGQKVRAGESILATFPDEKDLAREQERLVEMPQGELPGS